MCSAKLPTTLLQRPKQSFIFKQGITKIFNDVPVSLCTYGTPKYPSKLQLGTIPKTHAPKMTVCKIVLH
ncbi:hypothetical protein ACN42_g10167 [Penicillium freii]|uniref:Uncharacterized protein n=1 Tax=Penicillium freii TaxID=48697 RepID=A0A101MAJ4_PENFR|nr:hypothetical protein ACN42_g10167 [Penicillium freii]